MTAANDPTITLPSKAAKITGWALTLLHVPLFLMGAVMMLTHNPQAVEGFTKAGYPEAAITAIGLIELAFVILFLIPQTAILGALLLTAYLGGAVNHHIRAQEIGQMFMPILFGIIIWLALLLRDPRLRCLLPIRRI